MRSNVIGTDGNHRVMNLVASSIALGLGLLIKSPTLLPFIVFDLLFIVISLSFRVANSSGKLALLVDIAWHSFFVYLTGSLLFIVWRYHCPQMHAINPHPYSAAGFAWYMGALSQRAERWIWSQFGARLLWNHSGIVLLPLGAVAVLLSVWSRVERFKIIDHIPSLAFAALGAILIYIGVFFNANLIHTYYQLPLNFFFGLLFGVASTVIFRTTSLSKSILRSKKSYACKVFGGSVLLVCVLTLFAVITLHRGLWQDIQDVDTPYKPLAIEYKAAKFASKFISVAPSKRDDELVYVVETSPIFSGPHSLLYYLRRRGRVELQTGSLEPTEVAPEFKP